MANKHTHRCATSFKVKEIQSTMKTTMENHSGKQVALSSNVHEMTQQF